jgi:hypothetical protein
MSKSYPEKEQIMSTVVAEKPGFSKAQEQDCPEGLCNGNA